MARGTAIEEESNRQDHRPHDKNPDYVSGERVPGFHPSLPSGYRQGKNAYEGLLSLFQKFQGGFQGRQEVINRLALQAVDDIVPAPGGEDGFPAPGAPGTIFRGQLQVHNQFGDGQVIYIHCLSSILVSRLGLGIFLGKKFPN